MSTETKRAQKRWKRENRKNKGANTEAARIARNEEIRANRRLDGMFTGDDAMMMGTMLPLMIGGRKR